VTIHCRQRMVARPMSYSMFELFSDIFACRDNVLTRMDPRPKLVIAVTLILTVVRSGNLVLPLLVLGACLATLLALRIPVRLLAVRLAGPMGIVIALVLLQVFMTGSTRLFERSIGHWTLVATQEGLIRGLLMGSRVLGAVSVMLLLSSVTPAYKVFHALRWFRIPEGWVEIALLVYRYSFALIDQASDVATAQRVRLGYSNLKRSLSSFGVLAGTVITRSMDQAIRTHEAMMLRGYRGRQPFGPLPAMSAGETGLMCVVPVLVLGVHLVADLVPL
jgi:cobalt/nickel transport system permease protein